MAFIVPAMPLFCNVWKTFVDITSTYATPDSSPACALSPGKRVFGSSVSRVITVDGRVLLSFPMELLLPKGSDVLAYGGVYGGPSLIECPAGSHRLYGVTYVDDMAKGFANEYRFVIAHMVVQSYSFSDITIGPPNPLP